MQIRKNEERSVMDKRRQRRERVAKIVVLLSTSPFAYRCTVNISLPLRPLFSTLVFASPPPLSLSRFRDVVNACLRACRHSDLLSRLYRLITRISDIIASLGRKKEIHAHPEIFVVERNCGNRAQCTDFPMKLKPWKEREGER